ncbi:MAG TPA: hypothetical protein VE528_02385 [Thermoleophilaceae bacterium]|nr:hypothetical protein [Thermoleophilaceae bacterium]
MVTPLARLALVLALVVAGGCGGDVTSRPPASGAGGPTPDADISIAFDGGDGDARRGGVVCASRRDEVKGFLRLEQPADACRRVAELGPLLTSRPPGGRPCTQVYGGPERARFSGRFAGRRVDRRFSRTDGCEIRDWERVRALLPQPR